MSVRFSLDTNILVYAADRDAGARHERALEIVDRATQRDCVVALQALAEFFHATTRKGLLPRKAAADQVRDWQILFPTVAADAAALARALDAAVDQTFSFWDALLLATVAGAGCTAIVSEDMHSGAAFAGITVVDPFAGDGLPEEVLRLLG